MGLFSKKEYINSGIKFSEMLPVGSIVTLKNIDGNYMIANYEELSDKIEKNKYSIRLSYLCIKYPIGLVDGNWISVSAEDIQEVVFKGYNSSEREAFLQELDSRR